MVGIGDTFIYLMTTFFLCCWFVCHTDALAAGASIIGTGATPEGIDQNPPYYEYAYDTAWHASAQDLDDWFKVSQHKEINAC